MKSASGGETHAGYDVVGRIEARGVDHIPGAERHGHARELFALWFSGNCNFINITIGGLLVLSGLSIWQSVCALVVGNLLFAVVAATGIMGPRTGTTSLIFARTQHGEIGGRVSSFLNWFNCVAFEAINYALGGFALFALANWAGWHPHTVGKVLMLAALIIVTLVIAVLGHATIVYFQKILVVAFVVACGVLFVFVLQHAHWTYSPKPALKGSALWGTWTVGLVVVASVPLSFCAMPNDYTRYLPGTTKLGEVTCYAAVGYILPAIFLGFLAILAGTAVNMTDPQSSMRALMPNWFYPCFLLIVVAGIITNNILTAYSSGLSLQSLGLPLPRSRAVLIDAVAGGAIAFYAVFIANFLTTLEDFLQLMIVWYGAFLGVFVVDVVLRRNQHRLDALLGRGDVSSGDPPSKFRPTGFATMLIAMAVALLFVNTPKWQGPISKALSGGDISWLISVLIAGGGFWALERGRRPVAAHHTVVAVEAVEEPTT